MSRWVFVGKCIAVLSIVPALIYAHKSGPDTRHTGAPGDDPLSCTTAKCHDDTPLNGGGGKVDVQFPNGLTYKPGVKQTLTIVITDAKARNYGFQMTARLGTDLANGQAGHFTPGANQLVLCGVKTGDSSDNDNLPPYPGPTCTADVPIEFVEHASPFLSNTIKVDWTPPATDVGPISIFVAANAGNNNDQPTGDHICTNSYTLLDAPQGKPVIRPGNGVQSAWDSNQTTIADGSWIALYGTALANSLPGRIWRLNEVQGGQLPTSLDNVSVTVNNKPAYVYFVCGPPSCNPSQISLQVPSDGFEGPVQVQVTNNGVASDPVTVQKKVIQPSLLTWASTGISSVSPYVLAFHSDAAYTLNPGLLAGINTRPVKPGETIILFGTGFGPAGNPPVLAGQVVSGAPSMVNQATVTIGSKTLQVTGYLVYSGEYQFNIPVPPDLPDGDAKLTISVNGVSSQDGVFLTIKN